LNLRVTNISFNGIKALKRLRKLIMDVQCNSPTFTDENIQKLTDLYKLSLVFFVGAPNITSESIRI
jgi:hypothetical protein